MAFFALPTSKLMFCSLGSVQEGHFGKLEHSSLTESNRRKHAFAIIKTKVQDLTLTSGVSLRHQQLMHRTPSQLPHGVGMCCHSS